MSYNDRGAHLRSLPIAVRRCAYSADEMKRVLKYYKDHPVILRETPALEHLYVCNNSSTTFENADVIVDVSTLRRKCDVCKKMEIDNAHGAKQAADVGEIIGEFQFKLLPSVILKSCAGCRKRHYCSKPCQAKDWRLKENDGGGGHKLVCVVETAN